MNGVNIKQNLCPPEKYPIKCPYRRTPTRVVVHNTANDAPAENEVAYMLRNDYEISFHFAVDGKGAVQGLPLDRNAWASGDGTGKGNMEGIHVEICYSRSGGEPFFQAEDQAARLIAGLLKDYGWGMDRVAKHQDYDKKYCPHRTLDLGWGRFLQLIEKYVKGDQEMQRYEEFKHYAQRLEQERASQGPSAWAKEAWEKAVAAGLLDGSSPRAPLTREQCAVLLDRLGCLNNSATPR